LEVIDAALKSAESLFASLEFLKTMMRIVLRLTENFNWKNPAESLEPNCLCRAFQGGLKIKEFIKVIKYER
jgi:hypothetical protein